MSDHGEDRLLIDGALRPAQSGKRYPNINPATEAVIGQAADAAGQWHTEVRDWILFRYGEYTWPNFNLADCLLVCGAALLMLHAVLHREQKGAEVAAAEKQA